MPDNAPRAERRKLVKAIETLRRRLAKRASFEDADRRRLRHESQSLEDAANARNVALRQLQEREERAEAAFTRELKRLEDHHMLMEPQERAHQRQRLQAGSEESRRLAATTRTEFNQAHAAALDSLAAGHRQAAEHAAARRAEFDAMADQALDLQQQLLAHVRQYGCLGRRLSRAQDRALRPTAGEAPQ